MEMLDISLWPPTAWHWLALGLGLIAIEMALGTFDLLWIAIAAAVTSVFAAIAPPEIANWQGQLIVFAIASVILFIIGRTLMRRMRENVEEHPTLNKRMESTVGERCVVTADFTGGLGRVKLGDTEWSAEAIGGQNFRLGEAVIVDDTDGNRLKVRPA